MLENHQNMAFHSKSLISSMHFVQFIIIIINLPNLLFVLLTENAIHKYHSPSIFRYPATDVHDRTEHRNVMPQNWKLCELICCRCRQ